MLIKQRSNHMLSRFMLSCSGDWQSGSQLQSVIAENISSKGVRVFVQKKHIRISHRQFEKFSLSSIARPQNARSIDSKLDD